MLMRQFMWMVPALALSALASSQPAQAKTIEAAEAAAPSTTLSLAHTAGSKRQSDKGEKPRKPKPKPGPRDDGEDG